MHYWPFAWEYSIWNATVTALQFWIADLPEEILFGHFEKELTQEDEGYESEARA